MSVPILREKIHVAVAVIVLVAVSPFFVTSGVFAKSAPTQLSLQDVYQIGLATALQWDSTSRLYEMISTDQGEDPAVAEAERGVTARRISWNLDFVKPNTERHLRLEIRSGQVAFKTEVIGPIGESFFETEEVAAVHTLDYLATAKREGLQPGRGWATGYQFRLLKDESQPILIIRGRDPQMNSAIMVFDAKTNQLVLKQHKLNDREWQEY